MNLKFLTVLYTIIAISACENSEFQGSKAPPKPQPTSAPVVKQTQGSFSLYTEPKDPAPLQDYTIVIEVSLPSNITTYNASDLVGCVIGTDKYVYVVNRGVYNYGLGSQFDGIKTIPVSAHQVNSFNQLSAAAATNF